MTAAHVGVIEPYTIHCPRAGSGRAKAIFAGPDPGPQGQATLSLALARGQLDPRPLGSGQGQARADPDPLISKTQIDLFSKYGNFQILVHLSIL